MGHLHSDKHFKTQADNPLGASRVRRGAAGPARPVWSRGGRRGGEGRGRAGFPGAAGRPPEVPTPGGERGQQQAGHKARRKAKHRARRWAGSSRQGAGHGALGRGWAGAAGAARPAPPLLPQPSRVWGRLFPRLNDLCAVSARTLPKESRPCCFAKPSSRQA